MRCLLLALTATVLFVSAGFAQEAKSMKDDDSPGSMKKEPEINEVGGKPLDHWIKELSSRDPSKREAAMRNVILFGPDRAYQAMPTLLAELKKHSSSTPVDLTVRLNGAMALGVLLTGVKEPDPQHIREAVTVLRRFCRDDQAVVRLRAAQVLAQFGPEAMPALNEVVQVAQDRDTWEVRQAGVQAVAALTGPDRAPPPAALNVLYRALTDSAMQVRMSALRGIALVGPKSDPTTQAAMIRYVEDRTARDPEPTIRIWAHMSLMTVKQKITTEHLTPIVKMLQHADADVRVQAAQALATVGPPASKSATQPLVSALSDPEPEVVGSSIIALARLEASEAVPALRRLAADPTRSETIQQAAKDAVEQLQKKKG